MTAAEHTPRPDITTIRYTCPELGCDFRAELQGGPAEGVQELADQLVELHNQVARHDAQLAAMMRAVLDRLGLGADPRVPAVLAEVIGGQLGTPAAIEGTTT